MMKPQTKTILRIFACSNVVCIRVNPLSATGKNTVARTCALIDFRINPGGYRMITEILPYLYRFYSCATT